MATLTASKTTAAAQDSSIRAALRISTITTYALLVFGALVVLVPLFWMVSTSLKQEADLFILPQQIWPTPAQWRNYAEVWQIQPLTLYFFNTIFITLLAMSGEIVTCALVAYGFARFRFAGRETLFMVMLGTMMLPGIITLIPTFLIWRDLQRIDSFTPLTIGALFAWGPAYIFLLRQFFMTIPREIEEAAVMDGANPLQLFGQIMLPLVKPALMVMAVFTFLGTWHDFFGPLIYVSDNTQFPLSLGLYAFRAQRTTEWALMMAAATLATVPLIAIFFFTQRYFLEGIKLTGLKG
jgi:multiple sugar transport system permease protein